MTSSRGLRLSVLALSTLLIMGLMVRQYDNMRHTSVPNLVGLTKTKAMVKLKESRLLANLKTTYSETIPAKTVIRMSPLPKKRVIKDTIVTVILSKGPKPRLVPNLATYSSSRAKLALAKIGLVFRVKRTEYGDAPKGQVITTSPRAGASIKKGGIVTGVISRGKKPAPVVVYLPNPQESQSSNAGDTSYYYETSSCDQSMYDYYSDLAFELEAQLAEDKNDITRAGATGDLVSMAWAQNTYNTHALQQEEYQAKADEYACN